MYMEWTGSRLPQHLVGTSILKQYPLVEQGKNLNMLTFLKSQLDNLILI